MDEQLVLTAQTLRLNPHVQRADLPGAVCVLKNVPARKYLTVTLDQWNLLRNFANPATVPDVLRAVILNRTCCPLREYYELILKAFRAGILHVDRQSEPQVRARRWIVPLHPLVPIVLAWLCIAAAVTFMVVRPFPWPSPWPTAALDLLIGWGMLIFGVSAGEALAASVLHWGGGEIYDPRFAWLRPVPYFKVNLEDACMTDRTTQAGVWSAKLLPVMLTAVALWTLRPEWGTLHVLAVLVLLRPFGGGSVTPLLSALFRGHLLDTHKNLVFGPNRRWRVRLNFGLGRVSVGYMLARIFWGVGWAVLLLTVTLHAVDQTLKGVFASSAYWREVWLVFSILAWIVIIISLAKPVSRGFWTAAVSGGRRVRLFWRRWFTGKKPESIDPETVSRLMADSLVFRRLPPGERSALLKLAQPKTFSAMRTIQKFSDKPTQVGIIVSGRVAVYRRLKSGRADRVLELAEGDIFGAHALLDVGRPEAQIHALTPVVALMLPIEEFQNRVITRLGVPLANDLVQKVPFLRNLSFCRTWHPQAVARFAQLASVVSYEAGDVIVADRQDSHQFFLIYEGRVIVKREKKVISRLGKGAFFGEIGLLQNSVAVSDVITCEPVRCLTISKSDFLRFMTHNPLVGLQLEEISSERLGHPIFPLMMQSFDVR
jgi:CRP-like cAMP-binding protein